MCDMAGRLACSIPTQGNVREDVTTCSCRGWVRAIFFILPGQIYRPGPAPGSRSRNFSVNILDSVRAVFQLISWTRFAQFLVHHPATGFRFDKIYCHVRTPWAWAQHPYIPSPTPGLYNSVFARMQGACFLLTFSWALVSLNTIVASIFRHRCVVCTRYSW